MNNPVKEAEIINLWPGVIKFLRTYGYIVKEKDNWDKGYNKEKNSAKQIGL